MKKISATENIIAFLGILPLAGLFLAFVRADVRFLIPLAIGLPAFLIALTSLLFNRARAWPAGRTQRRSLFAAEILVRAVGKVLLSILCALVISYFMPSNAYNKIPFYTFKDISLYMNQLYAGLYFYIIPCLFLFSAYASVLQSFKLIFHKSIYVSRVNSLRQLFRSMQ